jgi:hypothetical protein
VLSYFKSQQPATVLAFFLFFVIIKIPFFLSGTIIPVAGVQNLWNTIGLIAAGSFVFNFLLAQFCLLIQAFWFNYLFQKADYNETSTMIPALYFSMVTSLLPQFNQFSIYILIGFVLLAVFQTLLSITIKENAKLDCFNLGMLGGILIILNAQFLFFIPFLFLMLYAIKPFRFNEYMMLFFGLLFPLYTAGSISYLFDLEITINGFFISSFQFFRFNNDIFNAVNLILTAVYLLMAFVSLRGIMYSTGFKRRKNVNMLVFFFIGITLTVLFCNKLDEAVLSLFFIPISVFLTLFMLRLRNKKWSEIFNAIFVIVTFITNIVRVFK